MDEDRDTPLQVASKGLLAGVAGALVVSVMVAAGRTVMSGQDHRSDAEAGQGISAGQALSEGPNLPPNMNRVTATFVQKIATGIFGTTLSPHQQYLAGTAWHLTYGGFWGMVYGIARSSLATPGAILGPMHGLAVWTIGFAWLVPKMKLVLPPGRQRFRTTAMVVGVHLTYGTIVAGLFSWLSRGSVKGD